MYQTLDTKTKKILVIWINNLLILVLGFMGFVDNEKNKEYHQTHPLNNISPEMILTNSPSLLGTRMFISELLALMISQLRESLLR